MIAVALGTLAFLGAAALLLWPPFGALISPAFLGPLEFANRVRVAELCLTVAGFSGTIAALITAYQAIRRAQRLPRLVIVPASPHAHVSKASEAHHLLHLPFHHQEADGKSTHVALLDILVRNDGDLTATEFAVLLAPQPAGLYPDFELTGPEALYMTDGDHALNIMQDESSDFAWKASSAGRSRGTLRYGHSADLVPGDECGLPTVNVALVLPANPTDPHTQYPHLLVRALASNAKYSELVLSLIPEPDAGGAEANTQAAQQLARADSAG